MPYWRPDCRSYFSVRTGTALERSRVPLRNWAIAVYLEITSLKSVSRMKLHRDIGVSQPTAWFMLHRIREGWQRSVRRPGRGGRDLLGRQAQEHQQRKAQGTGRNRTWPRAQDGGRGSEGSRNESGRSQGRQSNR